ATTEREVACPRGRSPSTRAREGCVYPCKPESSLGDRVVPARSKRVAARNATHGEPATAKRAVPLESFDGVSGAAWKVTARSGQKRRQCDLVAAHEENKKSAHDETLRDRPIAGDT